ncbi:DUF4145 domain-containing protein [Janthinobacterium sp. EB271-G4-7A]|uniref:DUF4145 domain-containing protein n=1 Tax=Janthinobacterium sp. EB271-G4-7A TaxID=2775056 RepID=UPI001E334575|nr:DUF4145 domain-containing protein [Janthinobacterium sp. EB271-G4-7A]MCC7699246.1 DUF4145 domain-containing protein [Janthinobacterium sp. EB271-G4-7A]
MAGRVKYEVNESQGEELNLPCTQCSGAPSHKVVSSYDEKGSDGDQEYSVDWNTKYQIVQCQGCKTISFRQASTNSEDYHQVGPGEYDYAVSEKLFPSRSAGRKGLGESTHYLPQTVERIYDETLTALANQCPVLSGIGLRALLETVCKEKNAGGGNLFNQIDSLKNSNILTPASAAILHKIRTLGNEAAHEVKPHTGRQLGLAMEIIEHLLKESYILPKQVAAEFNE